MSFYYRRKLRKIGKALLEASEKIELYRGDVLTKEALNEQLELADKVRAASKDRTIELTQVEVLVNRLHEVLVRNGGKIYPLTTGCDYTEMVVMALYVGHMEFVGILNGCRKKLRIEPATMAAMTTISV